MTEMKIQGIKMTDQITMSVEVHKKVREIQFNSEPHISQAVSFNRSLYCDKHCRKPSRNQCMYNRLVIFLFNIFCPAISRPAVI